MLWLEDTPDVSGIYNIGSGKARSFADLARAIFTALKLEPKIDWIEMPESLREKYQYFTEASMDRLRSAGWPGQSTPLEEGVRRYVQEHLTVEDPYR